MVSLPADLVYPNNTIWRARKTSRGFTNMADQFGTNSKRGSAVEIPQVPEYLIVNKREHSTHTQHTNNHSGVSQVEILSIRGSYILTNGEGGGYTDISGTFRTHKERNNQKRKGSRSHRCRKGGNEAG